MGTSHTQDNKRLAKNTVALYLRSILVLFVGLYVSRVLLQVLGVEDYGIYNVVGSVVIFFSFLNAAMTASSQRFLTFEIGRGDDEGVKRVFSVSLTSQIVLSIVLVGIMEVVGIWFLNNKLNIPAERLPAANWVFQLSIITFVINMIVVPYSAMIVAYEKLTFFAYVSIVDVLLKLGIVLLLSTIECDKLVLYAFLIMIVVLIMLVLNAVYCKKRFQSCSFVVVKDAESYKHLFLYSGWSLLGSSTNVATQNGFTFILNIFYGVTLNAAMGIANQVNTAVSNFVNSFQTSYRPQIVKAYAQNDHNHLVGLIFTTSKMSYALMVIPTLLLIFNMPIILDIWLTEVPPYAVQFCQIILICTLVDAVTSPYNAAIMATTQIRNYQIAISISFVVDLLVSYLLFVVGFKPYLILLSRLVTRGGVNMVIGWYYMVELLQFPLKDYLQKCLKPILIVSVLTIPVLVVFYHFFSGWLMLLLSTLFVIVSYYYLIMYKVLTEQERAHVIGYLKSKLKR